MRYFTSDLHLGSSLINKYAHRPFSSAQEAVEKLTDNICQTCDCFDSLIHVGDFMLSGADRHGKDEDIGLGYKLNDYLNMIHARVTLLAGNHDTGHNCEADCTSMRLDLNQNYKNVYVNHFPSYHPDYHGPRNGWKHNAYDINLCGHVHNSWKYYYDNKANVLNYNVGVDCHNYKPVRDAEITEDLDFLFKHHDFSTYFKMTCKDEIEWKKTIKNKLEYDRAVRKKTRYQKKGLTEAECLRRKEEALRKKGLLK